MTDSLLERLIDAFVCLPGVGRKTAQRFAYFLLERDREGGLLLADLIKRAMTEIKHCERCRMPDESELCNLCARRKRDDSLLCVIESPADLMAMENNTDYRGGYFVLHGKLSPMDDIGPDELGLPLLEKRIMESPIKELILAVSTTVEGDVTAHVIKEIATRHGVEHTSRIACGVPVGGELEYVDATTLAKAFSSRSDY